jgi:hypothetical protein
MRMCKDAWLTDALSLSPPCLFFAPALVDVSKAASSLTVEARTPFLVALLDALNAALSRACMTGRASDGAALAAVAVDALEKLWHTASWSEAACYAYVAALSSAVAAESKRLGAEFEQSSGGSSLQAIMLKLLEHMNTLSSPAAMTRALLLLAMYIPIKRNVEANVTAITRHIFDRMCHLHPAGQEGVSDAAVLLPALARLASRSPEAHAAVCAEVKQRLNHELQASARLRGGSAHSTHIHICICLQAHSTLTRVQEPFDNPALRLFNDVAAATTMNRCPPPRPVTKRRVPALTLRCSVRALLQDVPALRAWALLASPCVILEHPPSLPPPSDADEHASHTLSKK